MGSRASVVACYVVSVVFLTCLFGIVRAAPRSELPILKVTAGPRLAYAPADIDVVVIAKPDARNRHLAVSLGASDSAFAGSTQRSLDGDNERGELVNLRYPKAPPGTYLVVATLFDRNGKQIAQKTAEVKRIGRGEDD